MIVCQEDKTFKTTPTPIISKLSDVRIVSAELDYLMYEPRDGSHLLLYYGDPILLHFQSSCLYET